MKTMIKEKIEIQDLKITIAKMSTLTNERMIIILLRHGNVVCKQDIAFGTSSRVNFKIGDIVKYINEADADSVILLHNHPNSDTASPSRQDLRTSCIVNASFDNIGVTARHIVVAGNNVMTSDGGFNQPQYCEY